MLTVIGEALVDLVDAGDHRSFTAHPGGSPLNVAVGLARLEHPTTLLARLATDAFGRLLRGHAQANDIDLSAAARASEPTTLAVASLDAHGRAAYDFYVDGTADWQWTADELRRIPESTTLLHTGSLATWTRPGSARVADAVAAAHAGGQVVVSYDPNVRPALLGSPEQGRHSVEEFVRIAHLVKASDEDVHWLYPDSDEHDIAASWLALGARLVVLTQGPAGATAYRAGRPPIEVPAPSVAVVDTVGAGDSLMAALLSSLVKLADIGNGQPGAPDALAGLTDDVLRRVLRRSVLAAAMTCERAGADPPTAAELSDRELATS